MYVVLNVSDMADTHCISATAYAFMLRFRSDFSFRAEILQTKLVTRFANILTHAQVLQTNHLDVLKGRLTSVEGALSEISPEKDQVMFIDYNIRPFTAPGDWTFEPCATFYDTVDISHCVSSVDGLISYRIR